MQTKTCTKCGVEKQLDGFYKLCHGRFGVSSFCIKCCVEIARVYREENREKILEKRRKHYKENREKIQVGKKKYREENRQKLRDIAKEHRELLTPWVVACALGLKVSEATPELIEMKRQHILLHRTIKQLKETVNDHI